MSERLSSAWSGAPQARIQREERTRTVVQAVAAACSVTPSGVSAPSSSFCCRGPQRTSAGEAARAAVGVPPEDTKPAGASASGQCSAGNTHGQPRSLACWKPRPKPRKRGQSPRTGRAWASPGIRSTGGCCASPCADAQVPGEKHRTRVSGSTNYTQVAAGREGRAMSVALWTQFRAQPSAQRERDSSE